MKRTLMLAALAMSAGTVGGGAASAQVAVGLGIGTTGISGEVQVKISPWLQLRGGYNYAELSADDQDFDDITYGGTLDLTSIGAFVDIHPFSNSFVISAGALSFTGDNVLEATGNPTGATYTIDDTVYQASDVGTLGLAVSYEDKIAPYLGLGWDTTGGGGIGLKLLVGALFRGSTPTLDLTASGPISTNATFRQELANEVASANSDIEEEFPEILPMVQLGLTIGF